MTNTQTCLATAEDNTTHESIDNGVVSSITKALTILQALADAPEEAVGVSELAAAVSLPKSTAHRLLKAMEASEFVGRSGSKYRLGGRFIELRSGASCGDHDTIRRQAIGEMERLFEATNSTVHLAVLIGDKVFYLEKITSGGGCRIPSSVGGTVPATCTAVGKAILAFSEPAVVCRAIGTHLTRLTPYSIGHLPVLQDQLTKIAKTGYAFDREESTLGFSCVGAPIMRGSKAIAGISLSVRTTDGCDKYASAVARVARRISESLTLPM